MLRSSTRDKILNPIKSKLQEVLNNLLKPSIKLIEKMF